MVKVTYLVRFQVSKSFVRVQGIGSLRITIVRSSDNCKEKAWRFQCSFWTRLQLQGSLPLYSDALQPLGGGLEGIQGSSKNFAFFPKWIVHQKALEQSFHSSWMFFQVLDTGLVKGLWMFREWRYFSCFGWGGGIFQ